MELQALSMALGSAIDWSGLIQLSELVSLDPMLCPSVLPEVRNDFWPHIVNENCMLDYFTDFNFLKQQVSPEKAVNMLCVLRNPLHHCQEAPIQGFQFVGYGLVEAISGVSALSNCGGFPEV